MKFKEKVLIFWNRLDIFCKIALIEVIVAAFMFIISICSKRVFPIVFSLLQLAGLIIAFLMYKDMIKVLKGWIKYALLAAVAVTTVFNIMSYSWEMQNHGSDNSNFHEAVQNERVIAPMGAKDCIGADYSSVEYDFISSGFWNISYEAIEDVKVNDKEKLDKIETLTIDGSDNFTAGQEFDESAEIMIYYHDYADCNVTFHVNFIPNFIFSKYDVKFSVDSREEGTLSHGKDQDFEFDVKPGEHTFTFENVDSSSVKGEITLNIDCDMEVSYKISCESGAVNIDEEYIDRKVELGEYEAKILCDEYSFIGKDYKEVVQSLRDLGFTNILEQPQYDIELGITTEGSVASVTIDGSDDYTRGDVFNADAEVIIKYHLNAKDNPAAETEPSKDVRETGETNSIEIPPDEWSNLLGSSLADAKKRVAEKGYTATYIYSNSGVDATGDVEYFDDEHFVNDSKVVKITNADTANKTIKITIKPADAKDSNDVKNDFNELDAKLEISVAWGTVETYGKQTYQGFKIHQITGILAETPKDGTTWFLKAECEYKNIYGRKEDHTVEAYVSGTTDNPRVDSFTVY